MRPTRTAVALTAAFGLTTVIAMHHREFLKYTGKHAGHNAVPPFSLAPMP